MDTAFVKDEPRPVRRLNYTFWVANIIEMWERLAYYTLRPVAPIYIMQATEPGGLHLTAQHKGVIYMWWAMIQSILPMVTGGYADRYGYKNTLAFSITMNIAGYLTMAYTHSYGGFFVGIVLLAFGTAFFKPSLQATLGHQLDKKSSSLGWGIFYWIVNVGSLIGHYVSPFLLGNPHSGDGWRRLFLACAAFTALNYLMLFTYRDVPSGASKRQSPLEVFATTIRHVFEPRLLTWLLIMSCFWMMMYQLWDLQPNFIEDWVDSSSVAAWMPFESWREIGDQGLLRVPQQVLLSLNALLIVTLMVPVSWAVRKARTLSAMFFGMLMATAGVLVAGLTGNGWFLLVGIVCFSLGEMLTGPKKNEYLNLIAPEGKRGLYLGYVNIPVGVGVGLGSLIAGEVYGRYGEKATLALQHLASRPALVAPAARAADWSDNLDLLPELLGVERENALKAASEAAGRTSEELADFLRLQYRWDRGQLINLGLIYLAEQEDYRGRAAEAVDGAAGLSAVPVDRLARSVHLLPKALGVNPVNVLELVAERMAAAKKGPVGYSEAHEALWEMYGSSAGHGNNLALEYMAQGSDRLAKAIEAKIVPGNGSAMPVSVIVDELGIGRTDSFAALSSALGADPQQVDAALAALPGTFEHEGQRAYALVMEQPHRRFKAVARYPWRADIDLLRKLKEIDPEAFRAGLPAESEAAARGSDPELIASDMNRIQVIMAGFDWSQAPDQAGRILGVNPYEARALAATDLAESTIKTTALLWDRFNPQYKVWLPFAAIGVIAAVALAIFGQMAKRWKDMNV